jgi:NAD(P)H-flavin reductase
MSLDIYHELKEGQTKIVDQSDNVRKLEVVLLNNHNKTYHPGQYVQGHVIVDVKQAFTTTGM